MKKLVSCFAVASLLALGSSAIADICTIEATPAATLLLPYFEVDLGNPNGIDTFFSINNASAAAALTHVIVWSDMSVEALDFNVYLTGYDVQVIGMGLMLRDGILPVTADVESISPTGDYSKYVGGDSRFVDVYPGCVGKFPYPVPALTEDNGYLPHVQAILTGGESELTGLCGGYWGYGDDIARGYVTVDVVNDCTLATPCDRGYFTGPSGTPYQGVGEYDNILWGDWYIINYAEDFAQGDTLVHIEAVDPADTVGIGELYGSFWGRCEGDFSNPYASGFPWFDLREALPATFATRFFQNEIFQGGTDLLVWRDSMIQEWAADYYGYGDKGQDGFDCNYGPMWYAITGGLPERQTVVFDEQENPNTLCTISPCPDADKLFPIEAQRVSVPDLDLTPDSGWIYTNLNFGDFITVQGDPATMKAQAWITAIHSAEGRFSAGLPAIQLDSYCDRQSITLGVEGPFEDEWVCDFYYDDAYFPIACLGFGANGEERQAPGNVDPRLSGKLTPSGETR